MTRVILKQRAQQDLDDIWLFIAKENIVAADALLDDIARWCRLIETDPFIGSSRHELYPDLRSFSVGRYVVFYWVGNSGIEIIRVLHSARDINPTYFLSEGRA